MREKETVPFYGTSAWKRCREAALRRDHGLCQRCLREGRRAVDARGRSVPVLATVVHHKQHLDAHPELALVLDNLESLCDRCHDLAHPEKHGAQAAEDPVPEVARGILVERL